MRAARPETIKVVKESSRRDIVFALARKPGTSRVFCGGSDFTVYEIDLDQTKPEAVELGRHDSYVTGVALGWHDADLRRLRRPLDLVEHRVALEDSRGGRSPQMDPRRRRHTRWPVCRERGGRHGLPPLGRREWPYDPRARRPCRAYSNPLPVDALCLRDLARRPHDRHWRQSRSRHHVGPPVRSANWPRLRPRSSTPGIPSSGTTRSVGFAHSPSRPTAHG